MLAEVKAARERFGIEHLEIEDDNFTLDKTRALAILRGLQAVAPGITWSAHNGVRIDTLDEELLRAIKESRLHTAQYRRGAWIEGRARRDE